MISANVDKRSMDSVLKRINRIISDTKDYKKPLKQSVEILQKEAEKNFITQGFEYDQAWKPLSKSTREDRERKGYKPARPILVRTGNLKKGFRNRVKNALEAVVYNEVSYAKYHQLGGKKLPQRTILSTSKKSLRAIMIVFSNYVKEIISR